MNNRALAALAGLVFIAAACTGEQPRAWSGYVEGEYVYVSSPIGGALTLLAARRGDDVKKDAPLFELDDQAERAASEEASSVMMGAQARAANLNTGKRRQELEVAQAQRDQARALAGQADSDLRRQSELVGQGFVSKSKIDDAKAAALQARARVAELDAALEVARLPARGDERRSADETAAATRFALEQARWRQQQKAQRAPVDARVADTFFHPGEWVGPGQPVVSLLPPGATRARFFVPEREIGSIAIGQPVMVACDGCARPIPARISFIATQAEYTPPVIYSNTERAKLVFMVEARPDPKDGFVLHPGQPVDVQPAGSPR